VLKLIAQVTNELRQIGQASSEYQPVLLELEVLDHALRQLLRLRGTERETVGLDVIRALAITRRNPSRGVPGKNCAI
jgi:hypothetical protein